jgi:hypothetical protein
MICVLAANNPAQQSQPQGEYQMKKFYRAAVFAALSVAFIAGCGKDSVSFNTLEDARSQARQNAEFNAAAYRSENPRLQGLKIVSHGDSTQTSTCPQGDGWASVSIMNVDKEKASVEKYKVVA